MHLLTQSSLPYSSRGNEHEMNLPSGLPLTDTMLSSRSKSVVELELTSNKIKDCRSSRPSSLNRSSFTDLRRFQSASASRHSNETVVSSNAAPQLLGILAPGELNNTARPESVVVATPPSRPPPEGGFYFLDLDYFNPTSPHKVSERHYEERYVLPKDTKEIEFFEPDRSNTWQRTVIEGWSEKQTPEGQTYFYHEATRIYTFAWLFDLGLGSRVDSAIVHLDHYLKEYRESGDIPEDTNAVFDLCYTYGEETWMYYLTSQSKGEVFWLTQVPISLVTSYEVPVFDNHHIKDALEALFWLHVRMFPDCDTLPEEIWDETQMWLDYFAFDGIMSRTSTSPFALEDARDLAVRVKEMRAWKKHSTAIRTIASIMYQIAWCRFINYHGQRNARVDRDHTVFQAETSPERSRFFRILSPLLFFWPDVYLQRLAQLRVDNMIFSRHAMPFFDKLQEDWKNCITPATVILSANVGLLAIQSIDTGASTRSVAQIASYMSTLLSMGNIVACTILSRRHRMHTHTQDPTDALNFLGRKSKNPAQIELLAVSFSLPAAFFMWGILTFLVAMSFICFHDTSMATQTSVGVLLSAVCAACLCLSVAELEIDPFKWLHPEKKTPREFKSPVKTLQHHIG